MMTVEHAIHKITHDEYQKTIDTISCSIVAAIPDKAGLDNNLIMDMVLEGAGLFLYSRLAPGSEIEGVEEKSLMTGLTGLSKVWRSSLSVKRPLRNRL